MDFRTKPLLNVKELMNSQLVLGYLSAVMTWLLSFLAPVWPFVGLSIALVFADMYTGIRKARHRGEQIHSRGLRRTVEKIALYFLVIVLSEGVRQTFFPAVPVTYLTAMAICLTEFKSMVENVQEVTGANIWIQLKDRLFPPK